MNDYPDEASHDIPDELIAEPTPQITIASVVNARMRAATLTSTEGTVTFDTNAILAIIRDLAVPIGVLDAMLDGSGVPWKNRANLISSLMCAGFAKQSGKANHGRRPAMPLTKGSRTKRRDKANGSTRA